MIYIPYEDRRLSHWARDFQAPGGAILHGHAVARLSIHGCRSSIDCVERAYLTYPRLPNTRSFCCVIYRLDSYYQVSRNLPVRPVPTTATHLSAGAPIPGLNGAGSLHNVELYDIDYSYSSSVIADLQNKGKKVCSVQASNQLKIFFCHVFQGTCLHIPHTLALAFP